MDPNRYREDDFTPFLEELIATDRFDDPMELGIAKRVAAEGFDSLSKNQQFVFEGAISHFVCENCVQCGREIPWEEMSAAEDRGGKCGWCGF